MLPNVNAAATHAATKYLKGDAALSFAEDTMGNAVLTDDQSDELVPVVTVLSVPQDRVSDMLRDEAANELRARCWRRHEVMASTTTATTVVASTKLTPHPPWGRRICQLTL